MSAKLGEILVRENLVTPQQLREALDYQRTSGGRLGSNLVKLGIISDDVITAVLSRQYGVPSINLDLFQIEPNVIKLISQEVALKYAILPISKVGATLTLAMADPTNVFAMDDIKFMTGLNVEPVIASEASIFSAVGKYYSGSTQIDIFDAAIAFETEKVGSKNGKNGHSNLAAGCADCAEQRHLLGPLRHDDRERVVDDERTDEQGDQREQREERPELADGLVELVLVLRLRGDNELGDRCGHVTERAFGGGIERRGDVLRRAPYLVVPCLVRDGAHDYPDERRNRSEQAMFTVSKTSLDHAVIRSPMSSACTGTHVVIDCGLHVGATSSREEYDRTRDLAAATAR